MVKRKASTPSSSDGERLTEKSQSSSSKKKINHFVQSASLSSKNQLLEKVLATSNISGIWNNSVISSDDSEPETKSVVKKSVRKSPKVQKWKKEAVSSSDEVSKKEIKLPIRLKEIKQEKATEADNSSSDEEEKSPNTKIKPAISRVINQHVLSAKVENLDGSRDNMHVDRKIARKRIKREVRNADSEVSETENNVTDFSLRNVKLETLSTRGAGSSSEDIDNRNVVNGVSDDDEQFMQTIERIIDNRLRATENNLIPSSGGKVKLLQDIRVTPTGLSPKKRLTAFYPGLQPLQCNVDLDFSDSEDIHLLRIPKNVNPKLLKKLDIDLECECKINIGEKYNIKSTSKFPDPTLVVSNNCKIMQFKSNLRMKKHIKSKKKPSIAVPEKTPVPLPLKLKKRHPLFGSNFKHKIQLSEQVEQKLDEAIANILKIEKKEKRKHKRKSKGIKSDWN